MIQPEAGGRPRLSLPAPPIALAIKGVAGHADPAMGKRLVKARPIDAKPTAPQPAQAGGQRLPSGPPTDLQKRLGPCRFQGCKPLFEGRRARHLVAPVLGLGHLRTRQLPRAATHQGLARRCKTELAQLLGGGLNEPSPDRHQAGGILEGEHTGQMGREHLTGAGGAHQQIGLNPPALPELAEAVAHRKGHRFAKAGFVDQG